MQLHGVFPADFCRTLVFFNAVTYLSSELTTVSTRPENFRISEYGNFQDGLPRLKIELFMKCDS